MQALMHHEGAGHLEPHGAVGAGVRPLIRVGALVHRHLVEGGGGRVEDSKARRGMGIEVEGYNVNANANTNTRTGSHSSPTWPLRAAV